MSFLKDKKVKIRSKISMNIFKMIDLAIYLIFSKMGNKVEPYKCPNHPESDIQKICVNHDCI